MLFGRLCSKLARHRCNTEAVITSEFDLEPIVEWKGVEAKNIISLALDGTMLRQLIEAPTSILGSCGDFISWHVTGS